MRTYRRPTRVSTRRTVPTRKSSLKRQAFGNFASAMQQRDSTNVVISTQEDVTLTVPAEAKEATIVRNCNALLCDAQYFQNYLGMYDQYKLNAVRVSLEMTYIGNELLNAQKFPSIVTAWDRNGVKINSIKTQDPNTFTYQLPNYECVTSYSSANEKTIYYGSRWGVVRQLDAASMMEKSLYIPTSNTRDVLTFGNMYSAWNPQLLIALQTSTGVQAIQSAVISIHWQFDVTLRGLRKVVTDGVMNHFKPNKAYIGYAKDNVGLCVRDAANTKWIIIGAPIAGANPTINPDVNMPAGNGIIIPNDGLPANNQGI